MSNRPTESLLLDTHIWIWLVNGDERLHTPTFLQRIHQDAETTGLQISISSVWEVGMLEAKGRISFPSSCLEWVQQALRAPGIVLAPLTPEIAIASSRLPGVFEGDPADRIIIATAHSLGATLVTQNTSILAHTHQHRLPTLSAWSDECREGCQSSVHFAKSNVYRTSRGLLGTLDISLMTCV